MKKIDKIIMLELDGRITVRLYTGRNFTDAELDVLDLALMVSDGAEILGGAVRRQFAKACGENTTSATSQITGT